MGRHSRRKRSLRKNRESPEAFGEYLDRELERLASSQMSVTFDYQDEVIRLALSEPELIKAFAFVAFAPMSSGDAIRTAQAVHSACQQTFSGLDGHSTLGIACTKGCHWCCFMPVYVDRVESVALAERLRSVLAPSELAILRNRLEAWSTEFEREGRALCPLNVNGECSVYEQRPLTCRGFNSADAQQCQAAFERRFQPGSNVPIHLMLITITRCAKIALDLTRDFLGKREKDSAGVLLAPSLARLLAST